MKPKRKVLYHVTNFSGYWYQRGKWTKEPDRFYGYSSGCFCRTFKKALRVAFSCPAEVIIVKRFIKHGRWLEREYILHEE